MAGGFHVCFKAYLPQTRSSNWACSDGLKNGFHGATQLPLDQLKGFLVRKGRQGVLHITDKSTTSTMIPYFPPTTSYFPHVPVDSQARLLPAATTALLDKWGEAGRGGWTVPAPA